MSSASVSSGLVIGWALVIGGLLAAYRPRVRLVLPAAAGCESRPGRRRIAQALTALGRVVRTFLDRSASRNDPVPGWVDRTVGALTLVATALLFVAPVGSPVLLMVAAALAPMARRSAGRGDSRAIAESLPDVTDMLALAVSSGLSAMPALALVAPRLGSPLGDALGRAESQVRHGAPVAEALASVARSMPATEPLLALLVASHEDGAPLVGPLGRLSEDLRADRRRSVEARARQVPVRMLFPLVACCLPAFVLLTIVPPIVTAVSGLESP